MAFDCGFYWVKPTIMALTDSDSGLSDLGL